MIIHTIVNKYKGTYHAKEDEMFVYSETWEEHVVLGTEAQAPPDLRHAGPDVVPVDEGRARGG